MNKILTVWLFVFIGLVSFSSCDDNSKGGIFMSDRKLADARMEQMISAIKEKDGEALKALFSKKALEEACDFETDVDYLFEFLQGEIESWERDGASTDESIRSGKRSLMIRFAFDIKTDKNLYECYLIDYSTDSINPDNEGVYMLEVKLADSPNTGPWEERMRAGIYIH